MAEKQSGPVKPPTLDMQARKPSPRTPSKPADAPKSASDKASATPDRTAHPAGDQSSESPRRPSPSHSAPASAPFPLLPAILSGLAGALVAVLTILGLATTGTLTSLMPQPVNDQAERLTFAEEQVSEALVGFNALNRQVSDMQTRLDTAIVSADENTDQLTTRQDELETAISDLPASGTAQPADLSAIQSQINQLSTRIAAVQSGASSEDADTLTSDLADMRTTLSALSEQVTGMDLDMAELGESLSSESAIISALQTDLAALQSEPSLPSTDSQLLRLPLALSGLETALDAARPFATELQSLLTLVPNLTASDDLTIAAETGLPAPGRITIDFARMVPAIMAARPADPDAGLVDTLLARAQALLAIRPTGETGADPVTDTLARAEQALDDRQFASAADALAALPEPMQQAAGDTMTHVTLMGEAETLLTEARASVLAASGTSAQSTDGGAAE